MITETQILSQFEVR